MPGLLPDRGVGLAHAPSLCGPDGPLAPGTPPLITPKGRSILGAIRREMWVMQVVTNILLGDCAERLRELPSDSIDLIFTSPPYADQRRHTYGGIHPDRYVEWFLPISEEAKRR